MTHMNNNDIKLLLLALLTSAFVCLCGFIVGRATTKPEDFAVWYDAHGTSETMGAEGRIVRFTVAGKVYIVNASTDRPVEAPLILTKPLNERPVRVRQSD